MNKKTMVIGSSLAVGIFAVLICVGMVTGFSAAKPLTSADPVSTANTGASSSGTVTPPAGSVQYIKIDPVADKTTGDLLIVSGSTDLPNGTILMVQTGSTGVGYGGDTIVRTGTGGVNRFSAPVDTAMLKPGTQTITVTVMKGDLAKGDYGMGTLNATTTFTLKGTYLGTDTPVQATVTKDDYIKINTIGNRAAGDQFLITGTTSLPVGTGLIWEIMPYTGTIPTALDLNATGIMANNAVTKGNGTANRVSLAVDTGNQAPGEYIVIVGEMKGDTTKGEIKIGDLVGSTRFTMN
jgi:hypothetical protein